MAARGDWRVGLASYDHLKNLMRAGRGTDAVAQGLHRVDYRARARVPITRESARRTRAKRPDVAQARSQQQSDSSSSSPASGSISLPLW